MLPITQIMTLNLFNYTKIPSAMETDCYPLWFFPCWHNWCSNIFQRVFILFSTYISILKKEWGSYARKFSFIDTYWRCPTTEVYAEKNHHQDFCSQNLFGYFNAFNRKTKFELIQKYLNIYSFFRFSFSKRKLHISMSFKSTQKWSCRVDLIQYNKLKNILKLLLDIKL